MKIYCVLFCHKRSVRSGSSSTYTYLRVVYFMFMFEGEAQITTHPAVKWGVAIMVIMTLLIGLMPNVLFEITSQAGLPTVMQALAGG